MTEKKRYYRTNVNLEDNNHEPYYNIRDRKKEGNNVLFMVGGKYTSKEIVGRLNEKDERIKELEKRNKILLQTANDLDKALRELEEENERMKGAFKRKFDYDIEDVVDEICDEDW